MVNCTAIGSICVTVTIEVVLGRISEPGKTLIRPVRPEIGARMVL